MMASGCQDYLDIVPDNVAVLDHAFKDRTTTMRYLATCYSYLPYFDQLRSNVNQAASDEFYVDPNPFYGGISNQFGTFTRKGLQTADAPYFSVWDQMYDAIRDCNTFIARVPDVTADLPENEKLQWIAEVKVLKAFYHFNLMRNYGPIPVIRENLEVDVPIEEMRVFREPIDNVVEYLVAIIDEAMPDLPLQAQNVSTDLGHINQVVAATIKAEILLLSASPLFNGNESYTGFTNPDGTQLVSTTYSQEKWTLAAQASKTALDLALDAGHQFYEIFDYTDISDTTKIILNRKQCVMERWNKEQLFAHAFYSTYNVTTVTPYFHKNFHDFAPFDTYIAPTLATTEFFYSNNGVPIDEDKNYDYQNRFKLGFVPANHTYYALPNYETMNIHMNREARYYANLAFDGSRWFGNGRYKEIGRGDNADEESYVFRMKAKENMGKVASIRNSPTGLYCRKLVHVKSVYNDANSKVTYRGTFAAYRLAELYLMYAEALNESLTAPTQEVYAAIDAVRSEAGLKGVVESWTNYSKFPDKVTTKEGMREIIQHERTSELAFEGKRYYDLRRWKTADVAMNKPIQGYNIDGETAPVFNQIVTIEQQNFFTRDYLLPIATQHIRVNDNLVQNPLW
jgi:hypothetical protein